MCVCVHDRNKRHDLLEKLNVPQKALVSEKLRMLPYRLKHFSRAFRTLEKQWGRLGQTVLGQIVLLPYMEGCILSSMCFSISTKVHLLLRRSRSFVFESDGGNTVNKRE